MLDNPLVRLFARAVLAGALVFFQALGAADDPLQAGVLKGALTTAVWAGIEYFTKLNKTVGFGSKP